MKALSGKLSLVTNFEYYTQSALREILHLNKKEIDFFSFALKYKTYNPYNNKEKFQTKVYNKVIVDNFLDQNYTKKEIDKFLQKISDENKKSTLLEILNKLASKNDVFFDKKITNTICNGYDYYTKSDLKNLCMTEKEIKTLFVKPTKTVENPNYYGNMYLYDKNIIHKFITSENFILKVQQRKKIAVKSKVTKEKNAEIKRIENEKAEEIKNKKIKKTAKALIKYIKIKKLPYIEIMRNTMKKYSYHSYNDKIQNDLLDKKILELIINRNTGLDEDSYRYILDKGLVINDKEFILQEIKKNELTFREISDELFALTKEKIIKKYPMFKNYINNLNAPTGKMNFVEHF